MHRRGLSGLHSISPSLVDGKALPTKEAQLTDSRWNLLQDELAETGDRIRTTTSNTVTPVELGASRKPSSSPVESTTRSLSGTSGQKTSVFDLLIGKNRSSPSPFERDPSSSSSSSSLAAKKKREKSDTAEGEIRKLLGQPQF
jgi:hypothetical protein